MRATSTPFTRALQLIPAGASPAREILVRIGLPERDPNAGGDFQVLVEIEGFDQPYSRHFHGVDEIHAFLEGCRIVPSILTALASSQQRRMAAQCHQATRYR